ncbi:MAG: alpha/beta hydrolase [Bdellovibrionaceae bacterium]|nr:alpha/beta hydrolase [Pseudobdellovibrionaceae bacterium]
MRLLKLKIYQDFRLVLEASRRLGTKHPLLKNGEAKKVRTILGILTIFLTALARGEMGSLPYEDGKALCNRISQNRTSEVYNGFLPVPVDYKDPSQGMTEIYYSLSRKFDPTLPTVIFFSGGPGGASHWQGWKNWQQVNSLNINVVQFDQRGIACSRPTTEIMYKNPQFYSSENTARDANEIRKSLGANKITAYGTSYGTVPATIYANLFESSTQSLFLEGVEYSGMDFEYLSTQGRIRLIQKYFDSLPIDIRNRLSRISKRKGMDSFLPVLIRMALIGEGEQGWELVRSRLLLSMNMNQPNDDLAFTDFIISSNRTPLPQSVDSDPVHLGTDDVVNGILFCKELGGSVKDSGQTLVLKDNKIELSRNEDGTPTNSYVSTICPRFGLSNSGPSTFVASQYPTNVPVYYIQGTVDMATPPRGTMYHYKSVPKGSAYMLLFINAGHVPSQFALTAGSDEHSPLRPLTLATLNLFKKVFEAKPWTQLDVAGLNTSGLKTSFTSK